MGERCDACGEEMDRGDLSKHADVCPGEVDWRARALAAIQERDEALEALAPFVAEWDDACTEAFDDEHAAYRKFAVRVTFADAIKAHRLVKARRALERSGA